jgi:hypothetical protein
MARTTSRPVPTETQTLKPLLRSCPTCGGTRWAAYHPYRTITTLPAVLERTLQMRRCLNTACPQWRQPYRPADAGHLALPKHAWGLEVMACVGQRRYGHHRSVPAISQALVERRVAVAPRTVPNLLERYDALVALALPDTCRLPRLTQARGCVILALDGLQPDVGHAVLWGLRDGRSGAVRLARRLWSATQDELATLLREVKQALQGPIGGGITAGQSALRAAVAQALPDGPPPWCHVPDLREAAKPLEDADRHAKQTLQKRVRGLRPMARQLAGRPAPAAEIRRGPCSAVRRALPEDGRPPGAASGLIRPPHLSTSAERLERVEPRGPGPRPWGVCRPPSSGVCTTPRPGGPTCR